MDEYKSADMVLVDKGRELQRNGYTAAESGNSAAYGDNQFNTKVMQEYAASASEEGNLKVPLLTDESGMDGSDEGSSVDTLTPLPELKQSKEKLWQIALQVFFPYVIAGYGMVAAGSVLEVVKVSVFALITPVDCCNAGLLCMQVCISIIIEQF